MIEKFLLSRHDFLRLLAAGALTLALPPGKRAAAEPLLRAERPFTSEQLRERARKLSQRDYAAPGKPLPDALQNLSYDQYRDIRYRPNEALWLDNGPFTAQFFHLGFYYRDPVRIFAVDGGKAREVAYSPALFDFGPRVPIPETPPEDLGYAGFRLHTALNSPEYQDELIAFLGASYFRALARGLRYGLSARGLAIGTASGEAEEFPAFREFYLERPANEHSMVVHALLDSASVTGAYTFTIRPGDDTIVDVNLTLYPRTEITTIGFAPLTSMFLFAPNDRTGIDDFRAAVHDSDGLLLWTGAGEWVWRPLVNPERLRVSGFQDHNPKGFGLMQRERNFAAYEDLESHYEQRPSAWVEPVGDWGAGAIILIEIPTDREVNDNIVAFWRPREPVPAGHEWQLTYRLHWCREEPVATTPPARVRATRVGRGETAGTTKFVIDFAGDKLPTSADTPAVGMISTSRGAILNAVTHFNGVTGGWRVFFDLSVTDDKPAELRCFLKVGGEAVSETWSYQWTRA